MQLHVARIRRGCVSYALRSPVMHSRDVQQIFWTMQDRGHPMPEIAKCLRVSRATLYRWQKKGRQQE